MSKIKMILADDEPVIINGIKKLIDWSTFGIEIVDTYEDGRSAYEGILKIKPQIALLDISMPKMTGIEILKELKALEINTKVIFISGFQDFNYAKDALTYGAVDYLLKPVITEELIGSIHKCLDDNALAEAAKKVEKDENKTDYSKLIELENTCYVPFYANVLLANNTPKQMSQLINFSFKCAVSDYIEKEKIGITFEKNGDFFAVIKAEDEDSALEKIINVSKAVKEQISQKYYFIVGNLVEKMSQIPNEALNCLKNLNYGFFADQFEESIIIINHLSKHQVDIDKINTIKGNVVENLIVQNQEGFDKDIHFFKTTIFKASNGKKEDSMYYYCQLSRTIEEKINELSGEDNKTNFLDIARQCTNYEELTDTFYKLFVAYMEKLKAIAFKSDKQSFIKAVEYIENNYKEDITLNIMADVVHMNPSYFSAFFKKNAGMKFKEYVSKIRLEKALPILISTNKKINDIAMEVGFSDARTFADAFQKTYNETPNNYRKRLRNV